MTAREQDHADGMIREMADRKAHWKRVRTVIYLLAGGWFALLAVGYGLAELALRIGGVK